MIEKSDIDLKRRFQEALLKFQMHPLGIERDHRLTIDEEKLASAIFGKLENIWVKGFLPPPENFNLNEFSDIESRLVDLDIIYDKNGRLEDAYVNFMGSGLASLYDEVQGKNFSELHDPIAVERGMRTIEFTSALAMSVLALTSPPKEDETPYMPIRVLLLPMSDEDKRVIKLVVLFSVGSQINF